MIVPILIACGNADAERDVARSDLAVSASRLDAEFDLAQSDLVVSPARVDFERTRSGETSDMFVVVTNAGTQSLEIDRIHAPAPFRPNETSLRLEPGASQMLGVTFVPVEAGHAAGTLEIHSQRGTASVALSGECQGLPTLKLEQASIRFGHVQVGGRATASITIENHGGGDLRVTDMRVGGPFEVTIDEEVIAPASQMDLVVHFAPRSAGRAQHQLVIRSNDPKVKEVLIPLEGVGVDAPVRSVIAVDEQSLDFGAVPVGSERRAFLEIRNEGYDPLVLSSIRLAEPFNVSRRGRRIKPGGSLSLPVVFSPSEVGERSEFMLISSNDPEVGLLFVPIRGRGLARSAGETVGENISRRGTADVERVGWTAETGAEAPPEVTAETAAEAPPEVTATAAAEAPQEVTPAAEEGTGTTEALEPAQDWAGPQILEGSEVSLASYYRQVGNTDVGEFFVDRGTGTVRLEGVQLPTIDAGLGQFFTFSSTEGVGTVDSFGDIEVSLPLQVFDRWGNPNVVDVMLTTATSTAIVGNSMVSIMGQPVGSDGTAELVGLATFESGPLIKETIRFKLHVQVE